jgi:transglutaminase-like putative cysteine protease
MAGYGFSVARVQVAPTDRQRPPRHAVAVVDTAAGRLRSEIDLAADGTLARVRGGDAVSATRVDPGELAAAFDPPELVDQSAIPVSGPPTPEPIALELAVQRPSPPPALPGQRVAVRGDHWRVELLPGDQGDSLIPLADPDPVDPRVAAIAAEVVRAAGAQGQRAEVVALTLATAQLLDDDLASPAIEPTTALSLGRGDCTTHAVLFAALARARGITARLVTGYRLDGRRLVRHRWAVAAVDGAWIAVDPAHGEAPAAARLLGLAIHGAAASELAVVDELAFADMGAARARFVR